MVAIIAMLVEGKNQKAEKKPVSIVHHNENRDKDDLVTGQYSYVDPNGVLITVVYQAGPDGYNSWVQDGPAIERPKGGPQQRGEVEGSKNYEGTYEPIFGPIRKPIKHLNSPNKYHGIPTGQAYLSKVGCVNYLGVKVPCA